MNDQAKNKLAILILAAGCSSRLGQAKQLVKNDHVSLLQQTATLALALTDNVLCILGHQAELIQQQVIHLGVRCFVNDHWQKGLGSSIALGVNKLNAQSEGVLILLCDQWALTRADLQLLIAEWQQQPTKVIASCFKNRKDQSTVIGPPVIFPSSYFSRLKKLVSSGAKALLQNNQEVSQIAISNAAFDLDTPEDLKEFQGYKS